MSIDEWRMVDVAALGDFIEKLLKTTEFLNSSFDIRHSTIDIRHSSLYPHLKIQISPLTPFI